MADSAKTPVRKPRADAERNRLKLLATAKSVFASKGMDAGLEEIARAAGVGIGTLYRHFPTREALIVQVYRNEANQLAAAAERLAAERPPIEALRAWMLLFVEYFATKQIIAGALATMVCDSAEIYAASGAQMSDAMTLLTARAVASGEITLTVPPLDLLRAVIGVANVSAEPGWEASARAMVDILIAGLRVPSQGRD
ncbi:TetR/AcrR family transcriptional regulator [Sphingomonas sp. H39-1-10]|uniref:TetR/AcrR family transcriptional regulator n=1 Tax=Sphingomonas pollutisoli TaxID=3030829 RepID=UPI0023B9CE2D|nr:TetR/AcrR family transcriptional regulator [Sphingomonas pollutisoli]MDF0487309.1 TetR/AcrR family transcriptional regulator [Sphingomonas pollutisoli]